MIRHIEVHYDESLRVQHYVNNTLDHIERGWSKSEFENAIEYANGFGHEVLIFVGGKQLP